MSGNTSLADVFAEPAPPFEAVRWAACGAANGWDDALEGSAASRHCIRGKKSSAESESASSPAHLNL
eukprot:1753664-Pleurochrysis_carterae.AAC.1